MTRALRLSRNYIALIVAVIIVVAAIAVTVLVPRCSVFIQKMSSFAAKVTNDGSLATAPACTASVNSNEVYFVSCGGFF